jgi:hypothetical protein
VYQDWPLGVVVETIVSPLLALLDADALEPRAAVPLSFAALDAARPRPRRTWRQRDRGTSAGSAAPSTTRRHAAPLARRERLRRETETVSLRCAAAFRGA